MTHAMTDAVTYNRGRGYSDETWRRIQAVVATVQDGDPGPATARAVEVWQRAHGLPADGKVGPSTLAAMHLPEDAPPARPLRVGVWYDHAAKRPIKDAARMLAAIGVREVVLMLTDAPGGKRSDGSTTPRDRPAWSGSAAAFGAIADAMRGAGLEVAVDVWINPVAEAVMRLERELPAYLRATGAAHVEGDAEGNWRPQHVRGFASLHEAARVQLESLRGVAGVERVSLTSYPMHSEYSRGQSTLSHLVDELSPQAYSRHVPEDPDYGRGRKYGPGSMQSLSITRAASVLAHDAYLVCGLAAWAQSFPGATIAEVMGAAVRTAQRLDVEHVRYWSSKHILKDSAEAAQMRAFIASISGAGS